LASDPTNTYLWEFRLLRLEAEPIWDSVLAVAGDLDLTVGGKSFQLAGEAREDVPQGAKARRTGRARTGAAFICCEDTVRVEK